jgi:hypothetical protein
MAVPAAACCQTPDAAFFVELVPTAAFRDGSRPKLTWYDIDGRPSLVGLRLVLESGNRVYVAQRLQRIDGSGDPDSVDEYYVESRGSWRIGKQTLPFGRRVLLRENALAARIDTELVIDALPASVAYCDAGPGRNRGVVARVGREVGVSVAAGNHFGIQQTALAKVRPLAEAPGRGRGHRAAYGLDFGLPLGSAFVTGELVALREGETVQDVDTDVSYLEVRFEATNPVTVAWARNWRGAESVYSVKVQARLDKRSWLEPTLRLGSSGDRAFSLTWGVRL